MKYIVLIIFNTLMYNLIIRYSSKIPNATKAEIDIIKIFKVIYYISIVFFCWKFGVWFADTHL